MPKIDVRTPAGKKAGSIDLADDWFGIEPNVAVMHQVVTAQLAARRSGTQSTRTRAEVRGGGAKPWRQKGTGRARQGSIRSPQWRGGGVALGPKPRSYAQRTPKKMVRLALRSALSDRAAEGRVVVVDDWAFDVPRTKDGLAALAALGVSGRVLVVVHPEDRNTALSFRNIPEVHLLESGQLNAHDVLVNDWVVFSSATVPGGDAEAAPAKAAKVDKDAKPAKAEKSDKAAKADKDAKPAKAEKSDKVDAKAEKPAKAEKAAAEADQPADEPAVDAPTEEETGEAEA
jgi:large subunit ribosomal protein L4